MLGSGLSALDSERRALPSPASARPPRSARLFLTKFLLAFEVASLLLLVAAVGAVILARRRCGPRGPRASISVTDVMRGDGAGHARRATHARRR